MGGWGRGLFLHIYSIYPASLETRVCIKCFDERQGEGEEGVLGVKTHGMRQALLLST